MIFEFYENLVPAIWNTLKAPKIQKLQPTNGGTKHKCIFL